MCPKSFGGVRFDLRSLLQDQMWSLIPMMDYISPIIGHRGFGCEDNLKHNTLYVTLQPYPVRGYTASRRNIYFLFLGVTMKTKCPK